jgi:uncharacterized membrane protein
MSVMALYQLGIAKRLPELPLPGFNSEKVTSSAEGYMFASMPDSVLGLGSYAATLTLSMIGDENRARQQPWIPLILAGKTTIDLIASGKLTVEQVTKHRALCSWCLLSGATALGTLPLALPEARVAIGHLRGRKK